MRSVQLAIPDIATGELQYWFNRYEKEAKPDDEDEIVLAATTGSTRGFLTRADFIRMAAWKSARPRKHHEKNDGAAVREITKSAFASTSD